MDIAKIIQTMLLIGADLPAYKQLLDQVIGAFSGDDQETLKQSYADALAAAKAAHTAAQAV